MRRICVFCFLILGVTGCIVVPLPSKSSTGPRFSPEALAFLDQPGTTRADVLASLGQPLFDISDTGALIYVSEKTSRTLVIPYQIYGIDLGQPSRVIDGPSTERALFIAYDKRGYVFAHEIRAIDPFALESECREWRLGLVEARLTSRR